MTRVLALNARRSAEVGDPAAVPCEDDGGVRLSRSLPRPPCRAKLRRRFEESSHSEAEYHQRVSMDEFVGKQVVVDVDAMYVYMGKLSSIGDKTLILKNADVHDLRDSTTTREVYVREARVHGVQPNRKMAHVRLDQVVSVSLLDDVIP